jgi:hypothetical protein
MNRLAALTLVLAGTAGVTAGAGCGDTVGTAHCEQGARFVCACTNGRTGEQSCRRDETFGECECSGEPDGESGSSSSSDGGSASAGAPDRPLLPAAGQGGQLAQGGASSIEGGKAGAGAQPQGGAPEASAPGEAGSGGCETGQTEWCDGLDNDCDGHADNGEVCPDDTVANTEPFVDGVYLLGTLQPSVSDRNAVKRFWPTIADDYWGPFWRSPSWCNFRRSDEALFYADLFYGLVEYHEDQPHTGIFTPPCTDGVYGQPWFDNAGTVYYQCGETIRRGNGVLVRKDALLFAVLDDGRVVLARKHNETDHEEALVVVSPSGEELSRLNPQKQLAGTLVPDWSSFSVSGNHAYVGFRREFGQGQRELVVYRLDENSMWQRVRRLTLPDFGRARLPVSDGTVFVQTFEGPSSIITAYHPHEPPVVVWREADDKQIHSWSDYQLFVGPP